MDFMIPMDDNVWKAEDPLCSVRTLDAHGRGYGLFERLSSAGFLITVYRAYTLLRHACLWHLYEPTRPVCDGYHSAKFLFFKSLLLYPAYVDCPVYD